MSQTLLRRIIRLVLLAIFIKALATTTARAAAASAITPAPPNIVLILADDLGPGDLACYGQRVIRTPNIDHFAQQGMRFTQAYAGAPVCAPSRCCLLTGLHTGHAQIRDNWGLKPEGQWPLTADTATVAKLLKQAGYATAAVGKWGLGPVGSTGDPLRQGFDYFYGHNCQSVAHNHYADHVWENDQKIMLDGNPPDSVRGQQYTPDLMADHAVAWLADHKTGPFFLYFASSLPHVSLQAPEDLIATYRGKVGTETPFPAKGNYSPCPEPRATYAAMVTRFDQHVGRILDQLHNLNLDDNTIVFFASDNGPTFKAVGVDSEFFNSAMHLRGLKEDVYEGGIRMPLIVRWPAHIKPATTCDFPTPVWDLLPTAADLAAVPLTQPTDGVSILPTLTASGAQKDHDYLFWEFPPKGGQRALRKGNWKAVRIGIKKDPNAPIELYNLATDPSESHNVAAGHPQVVQEMKRLMQDARTPPQKREWNF